MRIELQNDGTWHIVQGDVILAIVPAVTAFQLSAMTVAQAGGYSVTPIAQQPAPLTVAKA